MNNPNQPGPRNLETELPDPLKELPRMTPTLPDPVSGEILTPPEEPPPLDSHVGS